MEPQRDQKNQTRSSNFPRKLLYTCPESYRDLITEDTILHYTGETTWPVVKQIARTRSTPPSFATSRQEVDTGRIYLLQRRNGKAILRLDLHFDRPEFALEASHAEDLLMSSKDKGSATVLPKPAPQPTNPPPAAGCMLRSGLRKWAPKPSPPAPPKPWTQNRVTRKPLTCKR